MPKRSLETLSEPMFYVLMALRRRTLCGVEIVHWIGETTGGRITLGPGTLYTILSKLTDEQMIREVSVEGRKRTYELTEAGRKLYDAECDICTSLYRNRDKKDDDCNQGENNCFYYPALPLIPGKHQCV